MILFLGLSLGSCGEEYTVKRLDYAIHGIDVSHYQSRIDWAQLPGQDIRFAFIKATEGETIVDSLYLQNWALAGDAGIHRGAYHFFRPRSQVMGQVLNFVRQVRLEPGDLPPVLDVETLDGVRPDSMILFARAWMHLIESHYGVRPILYSSQKFYNLYLAGHFDDHHLWIARYSRQLPELGPERNWQFWQYGDKARLEGIPALVDLNVFAGDQEMFLDLLIGKEREEFRTPRRTNP